VQKVCNESFNYSSDNQVFSSPRKSYKRKHDITDMNDFDKDVLCRTVYEFYDRGDYPTASKLRNYGGENRVFWITVFNIKTIKENGFQI
jgi:hypothetical protein